jgi:phosphate transport system substrate-binding protein
LRLNWRRSFILSQCTIRAPLREVFAMRGSTVNTAFAACLGLLVAAQQVPAAESLLVGGAGAATGMLRQVGAEFTRASGVEVDVVPGLGTAGAVTALADGKLDLAVSGRALTAEESTLGLRQALVVRTAFMLATSRPKPNGLKANELSQIYAATRPAWGDGMPIRIILRTRAESDTVLMERLFPGMNAAIESARGRSDVPVAATDQDNVAMAERVAGSLIGMTLAQFTTENPRLYVVPLDGVAPTLASFEAGAYPYTKRLYFLTRGPNVPTRVLQFLDYLRAPPGTNALRAAGVLPDIE